MSKYRGKGGINVEDHYFLKVYKVVACEARTVLYYIFKKGCPGDLTVTQDNKVMQMKDKKLKKDDKEQRKEDKEPKRVDKEPKKENKELRKEDKEKKIVDKEMKKGKKPQKDSKELRKKDKGSKKVDMELKNKDKEAEKENNEPFDPTMLKKIKENPSGDEFDVTLLNTCIRNVCTGINKKLYYKVIYPIIHFRNKIIHTTEIQDEKTMGELIEKLRNLLVKALEGVKPIYKCDQDKLDVFIKEMDDNINQIKQSDLTEIDVTTYRQQIAELRKANKTHIREQGVPFLKKNLKTFSNVDPASWISGREQLDVKMVFTRLDMMKKAQDGDSYYNIGHENLLELEMETEEGDNPTITVVEGDAGTGKSTLAKFILADWAGLDDTKPLPAINGLERYDLVLYAECKNRYIDSFLDLLHTLLPRAELYMTDEDLINSVLAMQTLVVVDGLDEANLSSEKLLDEMLKKYMPKSMKNLHFVITTRPQKIEYLKFLCDKKTYTNIKITGIPPERRVQFVEKLHDEMIKEYQSQQDTSLLVDYMKQSQCRLGEHYRLPLNLTLLTYLWASDPANVNSVTSATTLYDAVLELLKTRLISRIRVPGDSIAVLEKKVHKIVETVFAVYLETLRLGSMQLSEESQNTLKSKSEELDLPFDDVCGAFFAVDHHWTYIGSEIYLSSPHKSIMEFFSAFKIFNCLTDEGQRKEFKNKLEALRNEYRGELSESDVGDMEKLLELPKKEKTLQEVMENLVGNNDNQNAIDFSQYQNVLVHLGGLLAYKKLEALHQYGKEIVELLQGSNMTETQWMDMVAEAGSDATFTSVVAQQLSKNLVIRDGHTSAAIEIFKHVRTELPVLVVFETEVKFIPYIQELMEKLSERDCSVDILLKNHWKNPQNGTSTELLQKFFQKQCIVNRFTGNIENMNILPDDVTNVRITIANDDQARLICDDITMLNDRLSLDYLGVHVMKGVSPTLLKPLPVVKPRKGECGTIWLSGAENNDVNWACDVAAALLPKNMSFNSIIFPRCQLSLEGFKSLLSNLKENGVKILENGAVKTDSANISKSDEITLRKIARDTLNCYFSCGSESTIW